jgi:hypothetical protein
MNPPPMPSLLDLLTPLPPRPEKVTQVRNYLCAGCNLEPRKLLSTGKLDAYCPQCRYEKNILYRNKNRKT